jgi:pyrroloquinoline quinone biosynthesis protein B
MWLRVLGSAAGGGFPQWNCGCQGCRAVREGSRPCRARTQSSVAVSPDHQRWFLLNASPDIHGLLLLREGRAVEVHATPAVHETLYDGTSLLRTLEHYCPVEWRPVVPGTEVSPGDGLHYRAFDVPTTKRACFGPGNRQGRVVGYRLTDERSGRTAVYLVGMQQLTAAMRAQLDDCACLLVDGTCWRDDELIRLGLGDRTARDMGHLPTSGRGTRNGSGHGRAGDTGVEPR